MKRTPLNAVFEGLVHVVVRRDVQPWYRRTLCLFVLEDVHPYHWTEAAPTCIECITEDSRA